MMLCFEAILLIRCSRVKSDPLEIRAIFKLQQTDTCKLLLYNSNYFHFHVYHFYIFEVTFFMRNNLYMFEKLKTKRHYLEICFPPNKTALLIMSIFCIAPCLYNHLPNRINEITNSNICFYSA